MMKKVAIFLLIFVSSPVLACMNWISEANAVKAVALETNVAAGCKAGEPCLCFDGIDWETAVLVEKRLRTDSVKVAAKAARLNSEQASREAKKSARTTRRVRLASANPDVATTIEQLRTILRDLLDEVNDR
jgi:hypothetical protein